MQFPYASSPFTPVAQERRALGYDPRGRRCNPFRGYSLTSSRRPGDKDAGVRNRRSQVRILPGARRMECGVGANPTTPIMGPWCKRNMPLSQSGDMRARASVTSEAARIPQQGAQRPLWRYGCKSRRRPFKGTVAQRRRALPRHGRGRRCKPGRAHSSLSNSTEECPPLERKVGGASPSWGIFAGVV